MQLNRPLAVVTPTLDADVLAVLARLDAPFTTGGLHRVLGAHSEEGIRKVLNRLSRQGIVDAQRAGPAFLYRLNRDHLAASAVVELANLASTFLARLEQRMARWESPPVYAAVFGSAATGTMTPQSDLDLLLVHPDDVSREVWDEQVDALLTDISRWTGNDAQLLEFSAGRLAGAHDEPVLADVLQHGLTVAGDRDWLKRKVRG
ncbi:nucleotidyltransferase domain-containing protein [Pseudonocardia broussonetiae]|uniref:Nucleotidyltransferase domain-containing protein n=1 Tax=Pseudonocardia broussonetiae TaxID=2736640 RepID=A0A6M6JSJ6_9PSEU|nr:nucleotidyltransferase domain-containing protein [Pseudonocardia broussonetiae]QJY49592.1 nucleotidyltransferase domain-containing protein [Pseudonocardia broussonetiae]